MVPALPKTTMTDRINVLLIEDNEGDAIIISRLLAKANNVHFETKRAERVETALQLIKEHEFHIVIADLNLPDSKGIDSFLAVHAASPEVPVIVLTGFDDEQTAITAVGKGAQDYLVKDQVLDAHVLARAIRYALERQKLVIELERSLREIKTLRGLIPVCAWCRNVRDDDGYWKRLETYLSGHLEVSFTHGICPSCLKKVRPEMYAKLKRENSPLLDGSDLESDKKDSS